MVTLSYRMKSDILNRLAEEIYKYNPYPEDAHFCIVAEALIQKHPCLKEPGCSNDAMVGNKSTKGGNYRTELKLQQCPERSLKSKATADDFPSKKVKRPKQAEANFYPSLPIGESTESLEKERLELLTQIQIRDNERVIADKMTRLPIEDRRW